MVADMSWNLSCRKMVFGNMMNQNRTWTVQVFVSVKMIRMKTVRMFLIENIQNIGMMMVLCMLDVHYWNRNQMELYMIEVV